MKKAKIMLSAIAVLAVVGGALAFRTTTLTRPYICVRQAGVNDGTKICEALQGTTLAVGGDIAIFTTTNQDVLVGDPNDEVDAAAYCTQQTCDQTQVSFHFDN